MVASVRNAEVEGSIPFISTTIKTRGYEILHNPLFYFFWYNMLYQNSN